MYGKLHVEEYSFFSTKVGFSDRRDPKDVLEKAALPFFTCQLKGQIFLVLAGDFLAGKMKHVKHIYVQIFQKPF